MEIALITKDEHSKLLDIYNNHPVLTLQNKGYETPNKALFTSEDIKQFSEVEAILKKSVKGFREFTNFKLDKKNNIIIRLQYNYNYNTTKPPFTGVGYIQLDELLNGFEVQVEK